VAGAITIGPSRFEVMLPPGEIAVTEYYVQNETEAAIHVEIEPENWFKDAYNYGELKIEDWLTFDTYEFDLEPKEIKKIKTTITVPKDRKGELVAQIFFTSSPAGANAQSGGVRARLGGVLYVALLGTEVVDGEIRAVSFERSKAEGNEILKINIRVKNNGNVHLRPTGKVSIKDAKSVELVKLEMLSGRACLPRQQFTYSANWEKPELKKGTYKVEASIKYGKIFSAEKTASLEKKFRVDKNGEITIK